VQIGGGLNYELSDLETDYCTGDGIVIGGFARTSSNPKIYVPDQHVNLNRVTALHNARQGLSIYQAVDVTIQNSEFSYSGRPEKSHRGPDGDKIGYRGQVPGAGIDVEPASDTTCPAGSALGSDKCPRLVTQKTDAISISSTRLSENYGPDLMVCELSADIGTVKKNGQPVGKSCDATR